MGKRKVFHRSDLNIPQVEHIYDGAGRILVLPDRMPPIKTTVAFGRNATAYRGFDFARWYGVGIDPITYACQRQIERFLAGQDGEIEASSIATYCRGGLRDFLDYLILSATALMRELTLADIDRSIIDGFLGHLGRLKLSTVSQKNRYNNMKSVLHPLGQRGLICLITAGDLATFPRNPFPNSNRKSCGEKPLTRHQRQAFAAGIKQAVMPIWRDDAKVTGGLLACALLIVALHTGRNTTPLLEMERDCLRAHPKDNMTFLVLWKRRGHNTNKVVLRTDSPIERLQESTPTVKTNVERLIRRVLAITEPLRAEAPGNIKERVWLHRAPSGPTAGHVVVMTNNTLERAIKVIVAEHQLFDSDAKPMRINVSRLRKTFANRIFELLDDDLATTAIALGNTPKVAGQHYLVPDENAKRNWQFMGEILVQELLNRTIGTTYTTTPVGLCSDPENGQYAPKRAGAVCFSFLNCLRCKHYAVTAEDLYKVYSFYFRVFAERARMDKRRWAREYAHIPRLIDDYIVAEGLRRGAFKPTAVEAARQRARVDPHPFWTSDVVEILDVFA